MTAASTFCEAGGEVDFEFCIWQHDRPNIATNHHYSIPLRHRALLCNQNSAYFGMGGDRRDGPGDGCAANFPGDILPMHRNAILASIIDAGMADVDVCQPGKSLQGRSIVDIYPFLQREPGDCPVHGAGVYIEVTQALCQPLTYGAL